MTATEASITSAVFVRPHSHPDVRAVEPNGEAKVVIQDIDSYEQRQETLTLLKVLALRDREVEAGKVRPAADVIAEQCERLRADLLP